MSKLQINNNAISEIINLIKSVPEKDTSDATATASDIRNGKIAYVNKAYITGNVQDKTDSNISVSGSTVTVPAGYYNSNYTKTVSSASLSNPTISVSSSGLITASSTQQQGYVSQNTTKSSTKNLTTQGAKTITPSTSSQTAVNANVYTTGAVTVAAIPSTYVKPTATQVAKTWTPNTNNQTISAGTYCSGAQTIQGDSNLKAENIKKDISIFGVKGSYGNNSSNVGAGTIVHGATQPYILYNGYGSTGPSITYGTGVTESNGIVSIHNGTTGTLSSSLFTTLKGKYVQVADTTYGAGTRNVIFIPSDATVSGSIGYTSNVSVDKGQLVCVLDSIV